MQKLTATPGGSPAIIHGSCSWLCRSRREAPDSTGAYRALRLHIRKCGKNNAPRRKGDPTNPALFPRRQHCERHRKCKRGREACIPGRGSSECDRKMMRLVTFLRLQKAQHFARISTGRDVQQDIVHWRKLPQKSMSFGSMSIAPTQSLIRNTYRLIETNTCHPSLLARCEISLCQRTVHDRSS